jgi:hypothetical protein
MLKIVEIAVYLGALMVYLTPAMIADARGRKDALAITLVNVLLGWTVVGWFAALVWARHPVTDRRLSHVAKKTKRAITRMTIKAIVARARRRAALALASR